MTILEDIQYSAVDSKSDLATLLRKCKLLAARLGSQPLEDWLLLESNGYPKGTPVSRLPYLATQVFWAFFGTIWLWYAECTYPHITPHLSLKRVKANVRALRV